MTDIVAALTWKYGPVFDTADNKIVVWRHPTLPQPNQVEIDQVVIDFAVDPAVIEQKQDDQTASEIAGRLEGRVEFAITTLMAVIKELYLEARANNPAFDLTAEIKRKAQKLIDATQP